MSNPVSNPKGMILIVYRAADGRDSTNGGVSSRATEVLLVGKDVPEIFESSPRIPTLRLVERMIGDEPYFHAEPVVDGPSKPWFMFGGNFAYTSDSRFKQLVGGALPIHDRRE